MIDTYPIIGFQPDLPNSTKGVIVSSSAIVPTETGIGSGMLGTLVGAASIVGAYSGATLAQIDGTLRPFVGTPTHIYELVDGSTVTDRSRTSPAYAAEVTGWTFAQYGDTSLAANKVDVLNYSTSGDFADVTDAPRAKIVIVAGLPNRLFGMLFDYAYEADDFTDGIFWSPNPATDWEPSIATQTGNVRILDTNGGFTAAVAFRDGAIAFKAGSMYRGEYVGGSVMWSWTRISDAIGCSNQYSVCQAEDVIYFADSQGLWVYDGSYPRRMPGHIHKWFARNNNPTEVRLSWDAAEHLLWVSYRQDFTARSFLAFNALSGLWTQYGAIDKEPSFLMLGASTKYAYSAVNMSFLTLSFPSGSTSITGVFRLGAHGSTYGTVTINSMRPEWIVGGTDTTWCSAIAYRGPTLRTVTALNYAFTTGATGRFDGVVSDAYLSPQITVTRPFQLSTMSLDIKSGGAE